MAKNLASDQPTGALDSTAFLKAIGLTAKQWASMDPHARQLLDAWRTNQTTGAGVQGALGSGVGLDPWLMGSQTALSPAQVRKLLSNASTRAAFTSGNWNAITAALANSKNYVLTPAEEKAAAAAGAGGATGKGPIGAPGSGNLSADQKGITVINNYGPSGPPQPSAAQLSKGISAQLKSLGSYFPFNVKPFIDKAIREGGGQDTSTLTQMALDMIRTSKPYKAYFPNIFRKDGTMRMSESQYQDTVNQATAYAKANGLSITRAQVGGEIGNDVSLDEMKYRVDAASTIKSNGDVLAGFNQILASQGKPTIKTGQQALALISGKASNDMYATWTAAEAAGAAKSAGLDVSAAEAKGVAAAAGPSIRSLQYADIEKGYQDIAQQINDSGAELGSFGLTQRDLETIKFGGANRDQLAQRAQQALAQTQAQGNLTTGLSGAQMGATGLPVAVQQQNQAGE